MAASIYFFVMTLLVMGSVITSSSLPDITATDTISNAGHEGAPDVRIISGQSEATGFFSEQGVKDKQSSIPEDNPSDDFSGLSLEPPPTNQLPQTIAEPSEKEPLALAPVERAIKASSTPSWISIPVLGVEAAVVSVGLTEQHQMETPEQWSDVGWYQYGSVPGEPGRAVLAGHVDSFTGPAVFYHLDQMQPGDVIYVHAPIGKPPIEYVVRDLAYFWTDLAPIDEIFGPSDTSELVLITCGGPYDRNTASYLQRLVVYATLPEPEPIEQSLPVQVLPDPS